MTESSDGRFPVGGWQEAEPKSKEEILSHLAVIKHVIERLGPLDYDELLNVDTAGIDFVMLAQAAQECGLHFSLRMMSEMTDLHRN